jgi:hypothetical protein
LEKSVNIFHDDESWSKNANDPAEVRPKPASFTVDADFPSGITDVLTGKPAADEIDSLSKAVSCERSHVVPSAHIGPVFCEDSLTVGVDFNLPPAFHSGSFEPKVKAANPSEQTTEGHNVTSFPSALAAT